jgi:lipopolysaccharide export system protein LptA
MARQCFVSFAAVLACYWMYWFIAVPLIEPIAEERVVQNVTEEQVGEARVDVSLRQRELAQYFSPDDWEAKSPAIWQNDQMRLLFGKLTTNPDGSVVLEPCTLMFFPKGSNEASGRPIIMRTGRGAIVQFDERIVVRTVDLNSRKFVGGELLGEIRIFQRESAPGKGDDLEIRTHGVKMSSDRAWTPEPVTFRLGRSHGSGRELEIKLASSEIGQQGAALRVLSVRSLQLKREVRMRLEMGDSTMTGVAPSQATSSPPLAAAQPPASMDDASIEITCTGPFEFDMQAYAASFHQQVDVFRLNPTGESDQLNCSILTVYFGRPGEAPAAGAAPPAAGESRSAASNVRLIEARGKPVTMRSPTQGMYARCDGVDFLPGPPGEPGSIVAFGPGVIYGNRPDDPTAKYTASWARELRFEPDGPLYRAALHGATVINYGAMGDIKADEVFAWLSKKPKPLAKAQSVYQRGGRAQTVAYAGQAAMQRPQPGAPADDAWQIERFVARRYQNETATQSQGDVVIDSAQLHAVANSIEAHVIRDPGPVGGPPAAPPAPKQQRTQQNPGEQFRVHGQKVQIHLVPDGDQLAVAGATIERKAQLEQWTREGGLEKRSLWVKGDRLHVADANTDATRVTVSGQPGFVEANGMSLSGAAIELEKSTDRLWIDGPGGMTLPVAQDMDGKALPRPQTLNVTWKQSMKFQGDTAIFNGSVVARSSQQVVNTETLEARLTRAVDFDKAKMSGNRPEDRLDLAALRTRGWTFLEGRQLDENGQTTSFSQMGVNDLSIDRASGAIGGVGPGWIRHVTQGAPQALTPPGTAAQAPPDPTDKDKLTYLYVTFREGLAGNLNRRAVKFFDQTKTIYGPVADWNDQLDDQDLVGLGATGMSLQADALEVREMGMRPQSKRGYFELDAAGNVFAEGRRFTAQGEQMTYVEQNDQLALRGEPAELFMENDSGGPRHETRAKLLQYWFKDHRVQINGASLLNLSLPSTPAKKPDAKPQAEAAPTLDRSPGKVPAARVPTAKTPFGVAPR